MSYFDGIISQRELEIGKGVFGSLPSFCHTFFLRTLWLTLLPLKKLSDQ
jgi:hypothetical protein